jgi:MoaA/NifB/PqqE/SkfB family radical SAM enzyme
MKLPSLLHRAPRAALLLARLRAGQFAVASVNLLNRCNQDCPMCQVHRGPFVELTLAQLEAAFHALALRGVRAVELSGGEPFLRADLPQVIAAVERAGLLFTFNTNATAVTDAGLAALEGARGLLQVAVSLDSLEPARYRLLRGRDQLTQALAGLARLQTARLGAPVKLNVAVSKHNDVEVSSLVEFAHARGLFLSAFPVNQGPGAHRSDEGLFTATGQERALMAETFEWLSRRRGETLWEPPTFYRAAARFLRGERLGPCGAGKLYLDIRADGTVAGCVDLPPVASVEDLSSGRAFDALAAAQPAVAACQASTPCCYTCTQGLAEAGRHPLRFAAHAGLLQLKGKGP